MVSLPLEPGTEEYRVYNRVKRKYLAQVAEIQKTASDDEPCETDIGKTDILRAGLLALDRLNPTELPGLIGLAKKKKGRPGNDLNIDDNDELGERDHRTGVLNMDRTIS